MAIIPVVRGLGPVVPAEGWPPEDVIDLGRTEGAELDYVVTGSIGQSETATSVRLELWDIGRGEAVDTLAKETTAEALWLLREHGVTVKILTGDNAIVARKICRDVGLDVRHIATGVEVEPLDDR